MWRRNKEGAVVEGISNALDPFIQAALSNLDGGALANDDDKRNLAQVFVYGAIAYLADYDGLDKEGTRTVVDEKLKQHFELDADGIDKFLGAVSELTERDDSYFFMIEGASALRRWLTEENADAPLKLKILLG